MIKFKMYHMSYIVEMSFRTIYAPERDHRLRLSFKNNLKTIFLFFYLSSSL